MVTDYAKKGQTLRIKGYTCDVSTFSLKLNAGKYYVYKGDQDGQYNLIVSIKDSAGKETSALFRTIDLNDGEEFFGNLPEIPDGSTCEAYLLDKDFKPVFKVDR